MRIQSANIHCDELHYAATSLIAGISPIGLMAFYSNLGWELTARLFQINGHDADDETRLCPIIESRIVGLSPELPTTKIKQ